MKSSRPPSAPAACRDHPSVPAAARCATCNRPLCDELCFRYRLAGLPACAPCAYEASTRRARRASLAAAFFFFSVGGGFWLVRRYHLWSGEWVAVLIIGAVAAVGITIALALSSHETQQAELEHRDPEHDAIDERALAGSASPYRAHVRRALLAASPRLSGSATALVVVASLAASAVLLPASLELPRWVEAELVLALWWVIVAVTLAVLLYRGFRLRDDFVYFGWWNRPAPPSNKAPAKESSSSESSWASGCVNFELEGCAIGLVVMVAMAVAFGAAWIFVELVAPITLLLMYGLFMRAIGRVANDRHGCEHDLAKSIGWGALWATLYVLPIATLTWALHALHR